MSAVAQHDLFDVPYPLAVHEHAPGLDPVAALRPIRVDHQRLAILEQETTLAIGARLHRQRHVTNEMAIFAVHGHEVLRTDQRSTRRSSSWLAWPATWVSAVPSQ